MKGQLTLIIVAHRITTLESCDRIFEVAGGTVREVAGGPEKRNVPVAEAQPEDAE